MGETTTRRARGPSPTAAPMDIRLPGKRTHLDSYWFPFVSRDAWIVLTNFQIRVVVNFPSTNCVPTCVSRRTLQRALCPYSALATRRRWGSDPSPRRGHLHASFLPCASAVLPSSFFPSRPPPPPPPLLAWRHDFLVARVLSRAAPRRCRPPPQRSSCRPPPPAAAAGRHPRHCQRLCCPHAAAVFHDAAAVF